MIERNKKERILFLFDQEIFARKFFIYQFAHEILF